MNWFICLFFFMGKGLYLLCFFFLHSIHISPFLFYINDFDYNNDNVSSIAVHIFLDLKKKILIINCMIWAKKLINIFLYAIRNFISYFQPERMLCDYFVWNHRKDSKGNINDLIKILNTQILYIELLQSLLYIISCRQG